MRQRPEMVAVEFEDGAVALVPLCPVALNVDGDSSPEADRRFAEFLATLDFEGEGGGE